MNSVLTAALLDLVVGSKHNLLHIPSVLAYLGSQPYVIDLHSLCTCRRKVSIAQQ